MPKLGKKTKHNVNVYAIRSVDKPKNYYSLGETFKNTNLFNLIFVCKIYLQNCTNLFVKNINTSVVNR